MKLRWSRITPQLSLLPAVALTLIAFLGSIGWTVLMSFTRSRRLPGYQIDWDNPSRQYNQLFANKGWNISLSNLVVLALGFALAGTKPMTVHLANLVTVSTGTVAYNVNMAAALSTAIPPLLIYFVLGKFFVQGIAAGAIKG